MNDFQAALSEEIWELAKKGLPEGGDRPVSLDMIMHLKNCESCQMTLLARHINRSDLENLYRTLELS